MALAAIHLRKVGGLPIRGVPGMLLVGRGTPEGGVPLYFTVTNFDDEMGGTPPFCKLRFYNKMVDSQWSFLWISTSPFVTRVAWIDRAHS